MLLDTGPDINVIRKEALLLKAKIKCHKKIQINGVGPGQVVQYKCSMYYLPNQDLPKMDP